jgi:diguanylate cyclase (GGDEF)-like protein
MLTSAVQRELPGNPLEVMASETTPDEIRRRTVVIGVIPAIAAAVTMLLGAAVLFGWARDIPILKTMLPGDTTMKANSAFEFVLCGIALLLIGKPKFRLVFRVLASLVLAVAVGTLIEYAFNISTPLDRLLIRDLAPIQFPGRMEPVIAASFLLVAFALLLHHRKPNGQVISQSILLLAALPPLFGIVACMYGAPALYGSLRYTGMAFHTGAGLTILILGVLFVDPEEGIMSIFTSDSTGGALARVAIPASVILPVLLGAIFVRDDFNFGHARLGNALTVIGSATVFVGLLWTLAFFLQAREEQWASALRHANMDMLTGIMNRRYFELRLNEEIMRSQRNGNEFTVMLFDIDHFKALNDTKGHLTGDQVLAEVAQILRGSLRGTDMVCRYGGEEFVVIAFDGEEHHMLNLAEKLRKAVEEARLGGAQRIRMTISGGIARYPREGSTRGQLLNAADAALYAAKNAGRNRVVNAGDAVSGAA